MVWIRSINREAPLSMLNSTDGAKRIIWRMSRNSLPRNIGQKINKLGNTRIASLLSQYVQSNLTRISYGTTTLIMGRRNTILRGGSVIVKPPWSKGKPSKISVCTPSTSVVPTPSYTLLGGEAVIRTTKMLSRSLVTSAWLRYQSIQRVAFRRKAFDIVYLERPKDVWEWIFRWREIRVGYS